MLGTDPGRFLAELQARGIRFVVADDRLRWTPREAVTADEIESLRLFKPDLIRLLSHGDDQFTKADEPTTLSPPGETWDEFACRVLTETTGRTWRATTPIVLLDDDHS
ncbi:MAG: hypothetical protein HZA46_09850 [Planctomycetales bacterium]|nr:hypothetical protein [Planctomycetales bacterium]